MVLLRLACTVLLSILILTSCGDGETQTFPAPISILDAGECQSGNTGNTAFCIEEVQLTAAAGLVRREGEPYTGDTRRLCFQRVGKEELVKALMKTTNKIDRQMGL